jgi:hypothetical protein
VKSWFIGPEASLNQAVIFVAMFLIVNRLRSEAPRPA